MYNTINFTCAISHYIQMFRKWRNHQMVYIRGPRFHHAGRIRQSNVSIELANLARVLRSRHAASRSICINFESPVFESELLYSEYKQWKNGGLKYVWNICNGWNFMKPHISLVSINTMRKYFQLCNKNFLVINNQNATSWQTTEYVYSSYTNKNICAQICRDKTGY